MDAQKYCYEQDKKLVFDIISEDEFNSFPIEKQRFIVYLRKALGIIAKACKMAGVSRNWYYTWREKDKKFRKVCEDIIEAQIDYVESKLIELIEANNPTAIIFYLKTKGKNRGWNERVSNEKKSPKEIKFKVIDGVKSEN
ncbi:MAG: hypothetical protein N2560_08670 [Ignavibacteria bacterium]|nr:hypothetical protein [Ignavibacteria bacterium]